MRICKSRIGDMVVGSIHDTSKCGKVQIVRYIDSKNIKLRFLDTGNVDNAVASQIRKGSVTDRMSPSVFGVGFIGIGSFLSSVNGKKTDAYVKWQNMLERCYDSRFQSRRPTYKGCTVCDEWHNFQNFAKWYDENYPKDGKRYHLDKDLSAYGDRGKVYSPKTCTFISLRENNIEAFAKCYSFKDPSGEVFDVYNLTQFSKDHNLDCSSMCKVNKVKLSHHRGWTKNNIQGK